MFRFNRNKANKPRLCLVITVTFALQGPEKSASMFKKERMNALFKMPRSSFSVFLAPAQFMPSLNDRPEHDYGIKSLQFSHNALMGTTKTSDTQDRKIFLYETSPKVIICQTM